MEIIVFQVELLKGNKDLAVEDVEMCSFGIINAVS